MRGGHSLRVPAAPDTLCTSQEARLQQSQNYFTCKLEVDTARPLYGAACIQPCQVQHPALLRCLVHCTSLCEACGAALPACTVACCRSVCAALAKSLPAVQVEDLMHFHRSCARVKSHIAHFQVQYFAHILRPHSATSSSMHWPCDQPAELQS